MFCLIPERTLSFCSHVRDGSFTVPFSLSVKGTSPGITCFRGVGCYSTLRWIDQWLSITSKPKASFCSQRDILSVMLIAWSGDGPWQRPASKIALDGLQGACGRVKVADQVWSLLVTGVWGAVDLCPVLEPNPSSHPLRASGLRSAHRTARCIKDKKVILFQRKALLTLSWKDTPWSFDVRWRKGVTVWFCYCWRDRSKVRTSPCPPVLIQTRFMRQLLLRTSDH